MFDILVSGAGPTGMVSALAFAKQGFLVAIVDPIDRAKEALDHREMASSDFRSTAHLSKTIAFLEELDIWKEVCANACALKALSIINVSSKKYLCEKHDSIVFNAYEIGKDAFGYNIPIKDTVAGLSKLVKHHEKISTFFGVGVDKITVTNSMAIARLSDGRSIDAKLIVGADGGQSPVRTAAGISITSKFTGQTALAFRIIHEKPHLNISTEIYSSGGPLTLVPLLEENGQNASAIVWMQNNDQAEKLLRLSHNEFRDQLENYSCGVVGKIDCCSKISSRKVALQVAHQISSNRVVLIGEAAHLLPPIGAQGYNLSIQDIITLTKLASFHKKELGSQSMLLKYQKKRLPDIFLRSTGVGILNILAWSKNPLLQYGRATGLSFLQNSAVVRESLMRVGLG